jgi:hypothetical protein
MSKDFLKVETQVTLSLDTSKFEGIRMIAYYVVKQGSNGKTVRAHVAPRLGFVRGYTNETITILDYTGDLKVWTTAGILGASELSKDIEIFPTEYLIEIVGTYTYSDLERLLKLEGK